MSVKCGRRVSVSHESDYLIHTHTQSNSVLVAQNTTLEIASETRNFMVEVRGIEPRSKEYSASAVTIILLFVTSEIPTKEKKGHLLPHRSTNHPRCEIR